MNIQQNRTTALYCRLSRDDDFGGDSASIQTQKTMLSQYARDNGFTVTEFYVDDGYSGTNFDRPDFCRMISDIECGKVGTVIVKDLSRLGREYLKTGYYTEIFFPEHDVRFIAVNDNVDSDHGENEFAPFKNIINEWYAKDCSRKIKSALHLKARNGEFLGGYPAYGYRRSDGDRHSIVPDENAPIVKQIFELLLEGKSCYEVAKYLEQNLILTPRAFLAEKYGVYILEDNPYGALRFEGEDVKSIKELDTKGNVLYCGTFSKTLAPGLRVGYLLGASDVVSKAVVGLQTSTVHTNIWAQAVCAAFLERTDMDTYLDGLRAVYRRKCNLMADGIRSHFSGKVKWEMPQGGLFLWCTLPDDCDMPAFCTKAVKDYSIAVVPGNAFLVDETAPTSSFRLNYSTPSDELIVKGIEILGKMTKEILGA